MAVAIAEWAAAWNEVPAGIDELFKEAPAAAPRAARLASLLKPLVPTGLTASLLLGEKPHSLSWCTTRPLLKDFEDSLRSEFSSLDSRARTALRLPSLENRLKMRSHVAPIVAAEHCWGYLLLARPLDAPEEEIALADALLVSTARTLALRLRLEQVEQQRQTLFDELTETANLVLLGEAALGLTHDLNNCLNIILLQASILRLRKEGEVHEEVDMIRQQSREAAALLRPIQQVRAERRQTAEAVNLNEVVRSVVEAETTAALPVQVELAPEALSLSVSRGGLRRLVRWLLRTALARQPAAAGAVTARTCREGNRSLLIVEDAGPALEEPLLAHLFESDEGVVDPASLLERLAGQSLLQQFRAKLHARLREQGGLSLTVEWGGEP